MNLRNKKITLFLLTLATIIPVAFLIGYRNNFSVGVRSVSQCDLGNHVGYHYQKVEATADSSGHEEFYSCCICHQSWLDNPGGTFNDASDSVMVGGIDEKHIAFIPKKRLYHVDSTYSGRINDSVYPWKGGKILGNGYYTEGEEATLTAIADEGWEFLGFTKIGDDNIICFDNVYTFKVESNILISASFIKNFDTKFLLREDGYYLRDVSPSIEKMDIPEEIDGIPVVGIDIFAFQFSKKLKSLYLPKTIKNIEPLYFSCANNISSITVDPNNPYFDSRDNCNAIINSSTNKLIFGCKNTIIPTSVESIGSSAFSNCSFDSFFMPSSIKQIGSSSYLGAFVYCSSKSITVDPNNPYFDSRDNCNAIINSSTNELIQACDNTCIPNSVVSFAYGSFDGCIYLKKLLIPSSVSNIKNLNGLLSLESITVDPNNPYFDSRDNCNAIINSSTNELVLGCKNTIIPNSVTSIGNDSFSDCQLVSLHIPASIKKIGIESTSFNLYSVESITVDPNNPYFDSRDNCNAIINSSTNELVLGCKNTIIPDTVVSLGDWAFNCVSISSVFVPKSLKNISEQALTALPFSAESITVDPNNPYFDSRDNCNAIINSSTNELVLGCKNTIIPNSVTAIGNYAFSSCSSLSSIVIPNSVVSIGDCAFTQCASLTSITIPNSVSSIGIKAFEGCSSLTSITIPNSVISIGYCAFWDCDNLSVIYCEAESKPDNWDSDCFLYGCPIVWGYKFN